MIIDYFVHGIGQYIKSSDILYSWSICIELDVHGLSVDHWIDAAICWSHSGTAHARPSVEVLVNELTLLC